MVVGVVVNVVLAVDVIVVDGVVDCVAVGELVPVVDWVDVPEDVGVVEGVPVAVVVWLVVALLVPEVDGVVVWLDVPLVVGVLVPVLVMDDVCDDEAVDVGDEVGVVVVVSVVVGVIVVGVVDGEVVADDVIVVVGVVCSHTANVPSAYEAMARLATSAPASHLESLRATMLLMCNTCSNSRSSLAYSFSICVKILLAVPSGELSTTKSSPSALEAPMHSSS